MQCHIRSSWGSAKPSRFWNITRCPELLLGRNSVRPWIKPRIAASRIFMKKFL